MQINSGAGNKNNLQQTVWDIFMEPMIPSTGYQTGVQINPQYQHQIPQMQVPQQNPYIVTTNQYANQNIQYQYY